MFAWLRRPRIVTSLSSVDGPTLVRVNVSATSGVFVVSPASGVRCLLVQWGFHYEHTQYDTKMGGRNMHHRMFRAGLLGGVLQLACTDGGSIRLVLTPSLRVTLRGDAADMQPITPRIASAFPEIIASSATSDGQLVYNESFLLPGDRLAFKGVVARVGDGQFEVVESSMGPELTEL